MHDETLKLRNEATRLVDEERRRWYAAFQPLIPHTPLEGLAPEGVANLLRGRVTELADRLRRH